MLLVTLKRRRKNAEQVEIAVRAQFVPVAEGDYLITLDLLVCVEADVVAALFRGRRGAIAVDDSQVEKVGLVKPQYHGDKNDIETATGLPPSKGVGMPQDCSLLAILTPKEGGACIG
jgi:hypothetical protein